MALSKVLARGQVTLPREIRKAAGVEPGDTLSMRVTQPGKIEITVLPRLTLAQTFEMYHIEGPINWAEDVAAAEAEEADNFIARL